MSRTPIKIDNRQARRLWLSGNGLMQPPSGDSRHAAIAATVGELGMVQLDPLAPVARAHHHILWTRHSGYRPRHYDTLMQRRRSVFEHFTHDAAILPIQLWPVWARARERRAARYARGEFGRQMPDDRTREQLLERIAAKGPVSSRDFDGTADRSKHAWMRPPHKLLLEHLWLQGRLAVSHRKRFHKFYDLAERVIPEDIRNTVIPESEQTNQLCRMALDRMGMCTTGELQGFWDTCTRTEVNHWIEQSSDQWIPVTVENTDGSWQDAFAPVDIEARLEALPEGTSRVRILNPFDPAVRDRKRIERLFAFVFRIEIYVPAAKRRYGYYVFPVLQGDRFIGRIEVRADKDADCLQVLNWWPEPGTSMSRQRTQRLQAEIHRLAGLAGVSATVPLSQIFSTGSCVPS